jgi:hypothetical protein
MHSDRERHARPQRSEPVLGDHLGLDPFGHDGRRSTESLDIASMNGRSATKPAARSGLRDLGIRALYASSRELSRAKNPGNRHRRIQPASSWLSTMSGSGATSAVSALCCKHP